MAKESKGKAARQEFLAEAQELVESLSRDLLMLEDEQKRKALNPETLNDLFRGVHTLKGLAGMFGFGALGRLAHVLEDLLEDMRLGRADVTQETLDVLFEGAEGFQRLLGDVLKGQDTSPFDIEAFAVTVGGVIRARPPQHDILEDYDFDPTMLSALTEYEEHRLRANLESGIFVYRYRVPLSLDVIDTALEELKSSLSGSGEVITYLPSMGGTTDDSIEIEMLIATHLNTDELRSKFTRADGHLSMVSRVDRASMRPEARPPRLPSERPEPASVAARPPAGGDEENLSVRSLANVVRVDTRKLDHLMTVVGELGAVRNALGGVVDRLRRGETGPSLINETLRIHRMFSRFLGEVQDSVLDVRMVPLAQLFDKVAVVVRQVAREQSKDVRLLVTGADTEVDKLISEELADPLMHIVRNAIDHGVEMPTERGAGEKPEVATLAINAYHRGNHVIIEIQDDGQGIDQRRVAVTAVERGLIDEQTASDMSPSEMLSMLFMPGFSTRQEITDISGRGVGMDVVKTNVTRLGGVVDIESEFGVGTKVTITLPITLAIMSALIFELNGRRLAVPLAAVQEAVRLDHNKRHTVEGREVVSLRGETLPICRLGELFGYGASESASQFIVVISVGNRRVGLVVDRLTGQQDIVIKTLGGSLRNLPGIAGATDLGDQHLVLVVDAAGLLDEVLAGPKVMLRELASD